MDENKIIYNNETIIKYCKLLTDYYTTYDISEIFENRYDLIELLIPHEKILNHIYKYDRLYIYNIIDYFGKNININDTKLKNINNLLNNKNTIILNHFINNINTVFNESKFDINLYNDINTKQDIYLLCLFNIIFEKQTLMKNIDINILGKQLLIEYYHRNNNNLNDFNIKNDEYFNIYVKYNMLFKEVNDKIIYNDFNDDNIINLDKKTILKSFFYYCLHNSFVNKNVIEWFYVFFHKELENCLITEYYYVILNLNKNILGFVNKILNYYNIDFYQIDEIIYDELMNNLKHSSDYICQLFDEYNIDNSFNFKDVISNIFILNKIKNTKNNNLYPFIYNVNIDELEINQFFFIFLFSPLQNSWETIKNNIINIKNNIYIDIYNFNFINLTKIYNSIAIKNFKNNVKLICNNKIIEYDNIENEIIDISYFNINYLTYILIQYFLNYEIIYITNINDNIENITSKYIFDKKQIIHNYLTIYDQEKDNINGYTKFK